jgi:hypothetical protein
MSMKEYGVASTIVGIGGGAGYLASEIGEEKPHWFTSAFMTGLGAMSAIEFTNDLIDLNPSFGSLRSKKVGKFTNPVK